MPSSFSGLTGLLYVTTHPPNDREIEGNNTAYLVVVCMQCGSLCRSVCCARMQKLRPAQQPVVWKCAHRYPHVDKAEVAAALLQCPQWNFAIHMERAGSVDDDRFTTQRPLWDPARQLVRTDSTSVRRVGDCGVPVP